MLLCSAVVVAAARPAGADGASDRHKRVKAQQSQVQNQLNLAVASDSRVEAEVNRLDVAVAAQQAHLSDARRALSEADQQLAASARHLADLGVQEGQTRHLLVARALDAYIHGGTFEQLLEFAGGQIDEAYRRRVYLASAQGDTAELLNRLRVAKADEAAAAQQLQAAQAEAAVRTSAAVVRAGELQAAMASQQVVHAELARRIAGLRQESQDLAAQEGQLEAVIRAQQQAAALALQQGGSRSSGNAVSRGRVSNVGLIWPLHGPVTSEYGPRWGGFHPGIDIAAGNGAPIGAAKPGTVILAGWYGGYGNFVVIDHGDGLATAYGHLSGFAVGQGQQVSQGQVIGYEGSTGDSTGPHLHFEVRIDGSAQNPRNYESGNP
jgi:murein DD-endopeptidase MepM/ murein hydrolase activator NlpD